MFPFSFKRFFFCFFIFFIIFIMNLYVSYLILIIWFQFADVFILIFFEIMNSWKIKYFHVSTKKKSPTSSNEINYFKVILKCAQEWQRPMPKGNQWNVIFQWNAIKNSKCVNFTRKTLNCAKFSQKEMVISIRYLIFMVNGIIIKCLVILVRKKRISMGKLCCIAGIALTVRLILRTLFVSFSICRWS